MEETKRDPRRAARTERDGDTDQELLRQGYSRSEIEDVQRKLDNDTVPVDLEQLPRNLLVANALELEIPEPQELKKQELVEAIREAN